MPIRTATTRLSSCKNLIAEPLKIFHFQRKTVDEFYENFTRNFEKNNHISENPIILRLNEPMATVYTLNLGISKEYDTQYQCMRIQINKYQ